jgi:hypothetical protein
MTQPNCTGSSMSACVENCGKKSIPDPDRRSLPYFNPVCQIIIDMDCIFVMYVTTTYPPELTFISGEGMVNTR